MNNVSLIAYIPVLNKRHSDWLDKYPNTPLTLIPQALAEDLIPRLSRNIGALPTPTMVKLLRFLRGDNVWSFHPPWDSKTPVVHSEGNYILPDEDVSHAFAEKFITERLRVTFEPIWARYDMSAVKRQSPILDVEISEKPEDQLRMKVAKEVSGKSPDWWRQIGAVLFGEGGQVALTSCNAHYPSEYSLDIMGDPRINVDAGQIGKYTSFHSEKAVIVKFARAGITTERASLYTTVFPCEDCARAIVLAGISHVYFEEGYSALDALEILRGAGVKITQVKNNP